MSTDRKTKLEKAMAFDDTRLQTSNEVVARGKLSPPNANSRLAPLHAALIEAVEALEFYRDEENWSYSNSQTCPAMIQGEDIINREGNPNRFAGGLKAKEALAKIDEALGNEKT